MGVVALVIGIFFVVGIFVGAIAVLALPALRHHWFRRPGRRDRGGRPGPAADDGVSRDAARWEDAAADDRPRWPGDADGGYSAR